MSRAFRRMGISDDCGVDAAGGNWAILPGVWQWAVGRFVPT